jgi:hypothetical protein
LSVNLSEPPLPKIPREVLLTARACPVRINQNRDGLMVTCATAEKLGLEEQLVAEAILAKYLPRGVCFEFLPPRIATTRAASKEWFLSLVERLAAG